jgi:hypothetical protein
MKNRLAFSLVMLDPRAFEVLWVLLASAGINILTAVVGSEGQPIRLVVFGSGIVLVGILIFFSGQCAKEVRDRALFLQSDARSGLLRDHVKSAISEPGYSTVAFASVRWAVTAGVVTSLISLVVSLWR